MKTLHIQVDDNGFVVWGLLAEHKGPPWINTGLTARPEAPEVEGKFARMKWQDGAIAWAYEDLPAPPEPEPEAPEAPRAPTHAEIEAARAAAYRQSVDPITCEIARLRDMGGTPEEIAEAEARREKAVVAIKEQYPYPEETNG